MQYIAKLSALAAAGVTLGALLGDAADPEPKRPPEQWWQVTDSQAYTAPATESGRDSIWGDNAGFSDSYRPDLDYDTMITSYWEPPADWEWYGEDEKDDASVVEPGAEPAVSSVVAGEAADAAADVVDAANAEAAATPDSMGSHEASFASEGLY